jgi:hypothetical protein
MKIVQYQSFIRIVDAVLFHFMFNLVFVDCLFSLSFVLEQIVHIHHSLIFDKSQPDEIDEYSIPADSRDYFY